MQHEYTALTPEQRFSELDRMASQLFGSTRWKTEFSRRYDVTTQAIAQWKHRGPPIWALVAVSDALAAKRLAEIQELLTDA